SLPALTVRYADFAAWHESAATSQADLAWWRDCLAALPPPLDLPADRPRPVEKNYAGASVKRAMPAAETMRLREIAATAGTSLFPLLAAAARAHLAELTGRDDIVFGTVTAGREHPDTENIVGFFVNTIPLRGRVDPEESFLDLLTREQATTMAAFEHAGV